MSNKAKDDNELLQAGALPEDPEVGAGPVPEPPPGPNDLKPMRSIGEMLSAVYQRAQDPKPVHGVPSGHGFIDMMLGGFRRKNVTFLGAPTSWGKSSFSVMATNATSKFGGKVMLISAEDPEETFGKRLMASRSGVNAISLRDNLLQPADFKKMSDVLDKAEGWPFFQDGIGKSVEAMCKLITSHCAAENTDLVIVDYLQAIKCDKNCNDRRNEITYIARSLVDAIKNAGASGLIFSQIKRLPTGQKPTMNDFKESGDVENMAEHVIMGYVEKDEEAAGHDQFGMEIFKRYAIIDKNKDGPRIGVPILMPFDLPTASFTPISGSEYMEMVAEGK